MSGKSREYRVRPTIRAYTPPPDQARFLPVRGPWHLPACGPCIPLPFPPLPFRHLSPLTFPSRPPLKSSKPKGSEGALSPIGVWGGGPAEIEFGAF